MKKSKLAMLALVAVQAKLLLAHPASAQTNHRHVHDPDFFPFSGTLRFSTSVGAKDAAVWSITRR